MPHGVFTCSSGEKVITQIRSNGKDSHNLDDMRQIILEVSLALDDEHGSRAPEEIDAWSRLKIWILYKNHARVGSKIGFGTHEHSGGVKNTEKPKEDLR